MIYVYCPRISDGARLLTAALGNLGKRVQVEHGKGYAQTVHALPALTPKDLVVVWGQRVGPLGCHTLNAKAPIGNKFKELQALAAARVPCPDASLGVRREPGWIGRSFHHQCGNDLVKGNGHDYYVKLVPDVVHEVRMHVFNGRVFRTGLKVHSPDEAQHHPMFRTGNTGWIVSYGRAQLAAAVDTKRYWSVATAAVKAVGYDFGAVDLGIRRNGDPVVFEVNSAPGLDGNTITRYAEQIKAYAGER